MYEKLMQALKWASDHNVEVFYIEMDENTNAGFEIKGRMDDGDIILISVEKR